MTRYGNRRPALPSPHALRPPPTPPRPGWWLLRVVKRGPLVAARIELVHTTFEPDEPDNIMERSPFLAAHIDGVGWVDVDSVWRFARDRQEINLAEYQYRVATAAWAREYDPDAPEANPRRAIDLKKIPALF